VADLEGVTTRYAGAYRRFQERFCALEDGRASARAADLLLDWERA
jgi:CDP-glycerol glycerophosphotransferase